MRHRIALVAVVVALFVVVMPADVRCLSCETVEIVSQGKANQEEGQATAYNRAAWESNYTECQDWCEYHSGYSGPEECVDFQYTNQFRPDQTYTLYWQTTEGGEIFHNYEIGSECECYTGDPGPWPMSARSPRVSAPVFDRGNGRRALPPVKSILDQFYLRALRIGGV